MALFRFGIPTGRERPVDPMRPSVAYDRLRSDRRPAATDSRDTVSSPATSSPTMATMRSISWARVACQLSNPTRNRPLPGVEHRAGKIAHPPLQVRQGAIKRHAVKPVRQRSRRPPVLGDSPELETTNNAEIGLGRLGNAGAMTLGDEHDFTGKRRAPTARRRVG